MYQVLLLIHDEVSDLVEGKEFVFLPLLFSQ